MSRKVVIAFVALKGGAGKSTIAMAVACEWKRRGLEVLIIDLDDQQRSVAKWADLRRELGVADGPTVISMGDNFETDGVNIMRAFDVVIIDTPGKLGIRPTLAMEKAHLAIMPCGPNGIEVSSMAETFVEVDAVRRHHRKMDAAVLITKRQPGTVVGRTAHRAYADSRYQPLETELDYRLDYGQAHDAGLGPTTWAPNSDAAREVVRLVEELERRLNMNAPSVRKGGLRVVK